MSDTGFMDVETRKKFMRALVATGGNMSRACEKTNISISCVNYHRRNSEEFRKIFEAARERGAEMLESEAIRRAFEGVDSDIFYQDGKIGTKTTYSDGLMQFLLKGMMPDKYGDKRALSIKGEGIVKHEHSLSPEIQEKLNEFYK